MLPIIILFIIVLLLLEIFSSNKIECTLTSKEASQVFGTIFSGIVLGNKAAVHFQVFILNLTPNSNAYY